MKPGEQIDPFDWDPLLSALREWDEAERALSQAHIDMARDLQGQIAGFGENR